MSDDEYGLDTQNFQSSLEAAWALYSDGTDGVPCVAWTEDMGGTVEDILEKLRGYTPCRELLASFRLAQRETDIIPLSYEVSRAACARCAGLPAAAIHELCRISHSSAPPPPAAGCLLALPAGDEEWRISGSV